MELVTQAAWRPLSDWPYSVSDDGRVRNRRTGRILRPDYTGGYARVTLSKNNEQERFMLAVLVCQLFNGPCPVDQQCRHLDGCVRNNQATNLAWGTRTQNEQDKRRHGTYQAGENNPAAKLTVPQVGWLRQQYAAHLKERRSTGYRRAANGFRVQLAESLGVSVSCVKLVVYGVNW